MRRFARQRSRLQSSAGDLVLQVVSRSPHVGRAIAIRLPTRLAAQFSCSAFCQSAVCRALRIWCSEHTPARRCSIVARIGCHEPQRSCSRREGFLFGAAGWALGSQSFARICCPNEVMMKLTLLVLAAGVQVEENPIRRIVNLLQKMQGEVSAEQVRRAQRLVGRHCVVRSARGGTFACGGSPRFAGALMCCQGVLGPETLAGSRRRHEREVRVSAAQVLRWNVCGRG